MLKFFAEKMWVAFAEFCSAKATHIFSALNIRILCIESAKRVNEMTLYELVKLTMLWTAVPWGNTDYTLRDIDLLALYMYMEIFTWWGYGYFLNYQPESETLV